MKCDYDNEITLKALNLLHRAILLGDTSAQEAGIEQLVQLVRYFARKSSRSDLAEELENLERAANILIASGEIQCCHFSNREELCRMESVERFSTFNDCFAALCKGARDGTAAFEIQYNSTAGAVTVKVMGK